MSIYIEKKHAVHSFSPAHAPAALAQPGDTVIFETYDCYMGQLLSEDSAFADLDRSLGNPATGPLFIEGACPGDVLKVEICCIELDPVGILDIGPGSGAFRGIFMETTVKRLPVIDGILYYEGMEIPTEPMIGVIGAAPEREDVSSMVPMAHGGNMDCTAVAAGSVLYLPVNVPGALLAMGDLHAIMGEGECGNCGVEIGGKVTVKVNLLKSRRILWPVVETADKWMVVASENTVDEACHSAALHMYSFLTDQAGLEPVDAGMLIDMFGNLIVCQIVNPCKTVRMEMPKHVLKERGFEKL